MPATPAEEIASQNLSPKSKRIAFLIYGLMRLFGITFRWRFHDHAGVVAAQPEHPSIWIFWHNRIFVLPSIYRRLAHIKAGAILTSASQDGEIIAAVVAQIGCAAVRGSTSRRGTKALFGLLDWVRGGYDVAVVPDGPRGPRYRLGPGVVKLGQVTEARILPIRVEYGSYWTFKSWDLFRLPKPFTTIDVYFEPFVDIPEELDEEQFEEQRKKIETIMNPQGET